MTILCDKSLKMHYKISLNYSPNISTKKRIGKNIKVRFENKHDKISKDDSSHHKDQQEVDSNDEKVYDRIVEVFDGEPIK